MHGDRWEYFGANRRIGYGTLIRKLVSASDIADGGERQERRQGCYHRGQHFSFASNTL
jgi:hypothetical protein